MHKQIWKKRGPAYHMSIQLTQAGRLKKKKKKKSGMETKIKLTGIVYFIISLHMMKIIMVLIYYMRSFHWLNFLYIFNKT